MSLAPAKLIQILYFDNPEQYTTALSNEWSDYDLLTKSIRMGCKRITENLIDMGCRVEMPDKSGAALSMALKNGWTENAKKMLDQGAQVCDVEWKVSSPLRCAFKKKTKDVTDELINAMLGKYLLETTADFVHVDGLSFFHIACAKGEIKLVEKFLRGGSVNVDAQVSTFVKSYAGYSSLHFAVEFKRQDVVELLIKYKASIHVKDSNGLTPLHLAFLRNNFEAADLLLCADRVRIDALNKATMKMLGHETEISDISPIVNNSTGDLIKVIPASIPDKQPPKTKTYSELAEEVKELQVAFATDDVPVNVVLDKQLPETKADFESTDGLNDFHVACALGDIQFVEEILLGGRVNVNAQVSNSATSYAGYSALHFAVKFKQEEVIELLLKHKASIHVQDVNGSTALHLAFYERNSKVIGQLLRADREKKDVANDLGLTHFMIACTITDSLQAEQFLWRAKRRFGIHGPSMIIFKKTNRSLKTSSSQDFASYSPLHFAAAFGRLDTVQVLLSYNAHCCPKDGNWLTPTEVARKNGHLAVCCILERYCPDVQDSAYNSGNSSGASPLSSRLGSLRSGHASLNA